MTILEFGEIASYGLVIACALAWLAYREHQARREAERYRALYQGAVDRYAGQVLYVNTLQTLGNSLQGRIDAALARGATERPNSTVKAMVAALEGKSHDA